MKVRGRLVGGEFGEILIRQKSGEKLELGDLLVAEGTDGYTILQVYDLKYGSQISQDAIELLAGMKLEGFGGSLDFMEPELRNYTLAGIKGIARISDEGNAWIPKGLPEFFSEIRRIEEKDLEFFSKPEHPVYVGKVRSGSKVLDVDVFLDGEKMLKHHVLIPAITGRGKSNLVKVIAWSLVEKPEFGLLILDPHDEYYGRHTLGLKDHPHAKNNLVYYSPDPPMGEKTLVINVRSIEPSHFDGIVDVTEAQEQAMRVYHRRYHEKWIEEIMKDTEIADSKINPTTLGVLRRKFEYSMGIYLDQNETLRSRSDVFSTTAGESTVDDIKRELMQGKKVVIDTSRLMDEAELLIGSIVVGSVFDAHRRFKAEGSLREKPTVSVVIEEAPRVLSRKVLEERGQNIYSTIAREGRKFRIGLIAVTQLTSLIPRTILTNMNTKIILANEMKAERKAIIDSAAQDLSKDDHTIASLDVGEALVSSNFTKFAVPVKVPLFKEYAEEELVKADEREEVRMAYEGVDLT